MSRQENRKSWSFAYRSKILFHRKLERTGTTVTDSERTGADAVGSVAQVMDIGLL
jgi:hypothetical protein